MLRMPQSVRYPTSPWHAYLQAVYRTSAQLPLPFDLRRLEAFYPALLPVLPCTIDAHLRRTVRSTAARASSCAPEVCSAWLPTTPTRGLERAAELAAFTANRACK